MSVSSYNLNSACCDAVPSKLYVPVPLAWKLNPTFASPPVAERTGFHPVAEFAKVTSFTALATVSKIINSLPFASAIYHRSSNLGAVSVLLVRVSVLDTVGTLTDATLNLPAHFGTRFIFISVLPPVAVWVIVQIHQVNTL